MNLAESTLKYPALMAYILDRNKLETSGQWYGAVLTGLPELRS
jgi:hypothetical protein